ncbi:hypothetical protein [Phaeobacter gallaeciensis]|uniref:Response regulatory domain-containing protein n=1 Tax=Phaeobacter gallaeciensis TaxID=60890 RepID=A0ABD4XFB4_9RHOB|nr:hypothetical protein [Phaeobacter gallaeciensis]MDE4142931.1 hypothetical protein [Phaeobacter gallaeciensis]MDE4147150.1 hypothetical protein [Phaeobacter gallaeciensis]MDE4151376.1 hypothetical protein [Phaeobacter gallaeciensis]MDE4155607.1 hypothetical protein [Phaeobacter gallaeciensis]MDE4159793.1 hypothetical protein [Phaeobacter gallaeciensis]
MYELKTVIYLGRLNEATPRVFEYFNRRGAQIIYADPHAGFQSYWREEGSVLFVDVEGLGGQKQVDEFLINLNFNRDSVPTILFFATKTNWQKQNIANYSGVSQLHGFDDPYSVEFSIAQVFASRMARSKAGKISCLTRNETDRASDCGAT